ncbi:MAG: F0F1 ATP synthase subunit delta [Bacteroidales bacterium]|nr:F0F1 ATP synthase subunit delta [Bacteroidales bacterium]
MDNGKISVRYARALLNYANEQHCETEVYANLTRLTANYAHAIQQFNEVLSNPMVGSGDKTQLLLTAIGEEVHPCLTRFLEFLAEKKRENKIFLIALKYQEMYRKEKNLLRANVTTATELDEKALEGIKNFVEQTFGREAEMHVDTDPKLIGGFTLDIEHNRMDASVKGQLEKLKKELQL